MNRNFSILMISTFISLCLSMTASAYDVVIDGIYYDLNKINNCAKVTFDDKNPKSYSGEIVIPSTIKVDGTDFSVSCIGRNAFRGCEYLASVAIPNSVLSIESNSFFDCKKIQSIDIPNSVTNLGDSVFYNCINLVTVGISNSIRTIGKCLFYGCISLPSVEIPASVTYIDNRAFYGCSSLSSAAIPNTVTIIGEGAFSDCSRLSSISIPNSVTIICSEAFSSCSNLTSVTIPNSVTKLLDYAFAYCRKLSNVDLSNSITIIDRSTFIGCSSLNSIIIPNSVTEIGESAFYGCSSLTSIKIPNSVTSIGDCSFYGCNEIKNIISVNDMFVYLPRKYTGHYSIPQNTTKILGGAFEMCSNLTSVDIPNSVTRIGERAFSECYNLSSVEIPNSVTYIGDWAFNECRGVTSINIPNSVTTILKGAFYGCSNLTSVSLPNSLTNFGDIVFEDCNNIKKVYCDCSINPEIKTSALEELYIGDNVTQVFDYFKLLPIRKVVLGKRVSFISDYAFRGSKIEEFTINGEDYPNCHDNIFGTQNLSRATLFVPSSRSDYYQKTEPWSRFGNIQAISADNPTEQKQCDTPRISFVNGKIQFDCDTEDVEYSSSVTCDDCRTFDTDVVDLNACYNISVVATKDGYMDSEPSYAKLCWLAQANQTNNIDIEERRGILIYSIGGTIFISGLANDEKVYFYDTNGSVLGTANSIGGSSFFSTKSGSIVIIMIGNERIEIEIN